MSLSTHHTNLSLNAKASGKKFVLKVIKNLDIDRSAWLSDVVLKSSLLGTHDTIREQWSPKDHDHEVKFLRSSVSLAIKSKKSAEEVKGDPAASEKQPDSSSTIDGVKAEEKTLASATHPSEGDGSSSSAQQTSQRDEKEKEHNDEIRRLCQYISH